MTSSIFKMLCRYVSSIAIFMAICTIIACLVTTIWWIIPIGSESNMRIARWGIGAFITMGLIASHKITINESTVD